MESEKSVSLQIKDAIRLCRLRSRPYFAGFFNEDEMQQALPILEKEIPDNYMTWGGFENADRVMIGVFPDYLPCDKELFPIKTVEILYDSRFGLSHRDFLGAVMSLGIKRSFVGDIKIASGVAYVMLRTEIAPYVVSQMSKIGRVGVKAALSAFSDCKFEDDLQFLNLTVSSLRLDNVVSAVLNLSRDKSAQAVKSGLVSVNHAIKQLPSFILKESDTVIYKGKGKFVLFELAGESKKGKKKLIIKKYR